MTDLQSFLITAIKGYVAESPLNRLQDIDGSSIWDEPLVGFADGDDPLFSRYKTVVGEFHLLPRQALAAHVAAETGTISHVSIVSWVLPISEKTRQSNAQMSEGPSLRWNHTRFQGEDFNDSLRRHVVRLLEEKGYLAVAPVISSQFQTVALANGMASSWSERHVAYAAGLGTFGLSDGLITARGIAHRCGSVVFDAGCVPASRPYSNHQEYCLHAAGGACGVCIERCPAGAITAAGHDKIKCNAYLHSLASWLAKPGYIGSGYVGCGLCQTDVPCEAGIPE